MSKYFNRFCFAAAMVYALLCVSCANLFSAEKASVTIQMPGSFVARASAISPSDIAVYNVTLAAADGKFSQTVSAVPGGSAVFSGVADGSYAVTAKGLTAAGLYMAYGTASAEVSGGQNTVVQIAMALLTVADTPVIKTQPTGSSLLLDSGKAAATLSVTVSSTSGTLSFAWYESTNSDMRDAVSI